MYLLIKVLYEKNYSLESLPQAQSYTKKTFSRRLYDIWSSSFLQYVNFSTIESTGS